MKNPQTLRQIIASGFAGFEREKLEFWSDDDLPNASWAYNTECDQIERFSKGEQLEQIPLRTWICTDTRVGLYAVLWRGELLAFTYQECRKCDTNWWFVEENGEKRMWECFNSYAIATFQRTCNTVRPTDQVYDTVFDPEATYDWQTGPL